LTALAPVGFTIGIAGLELRASRLPALGDLVGDLSIGTSAALFVLSFILGSIGFLGPGLLLLLLGSLIFGVVGYRNRARPQMASALVGIGAGGILVFLLGGAATGATAGEGLGIPSLIALVLFCLGWGWLGVDLFLGRPLAIPESRK
jgi:hypothetical protein